MKASTPTHDSLTRYYKEVEATHMLTADVERDLIKQYQLNKSPIARDRIVKGALRYVISEARKHPRSHVERQTLEDLIAAGNIGLIRALTKFKPEAGTRFLTYASWWVRHEMREESRRLGLVHVPAHAVARGTRTPLTTEYCENTTNEDCALCHDADVEFQQSILKLFELTDLSTREIYIIKASYGIHTAPKTLRQIGLMLEVTGERVRQLREMAIAKLRAIATRLD